MQCTVAPPGHPAKAKWVQSEEGFFSGHLGRKTCGQKKTYWCAIKIPCQNCLRETWHFRFQINLSKTITSNNVCYTLLNSLWTYTHASSGFLSHLLYCIRPLNRLWCGKSSFPLIKSHKLRLYYAFYISCVICYYYIKSAIHDLNPYDLYKDNTVANISNIRLRERMNNRSL